MLILTRRSNESIMIGENIEIIVSSIQGDRVKLAIKAPNHVKVHRREIFLKEEANKNKPNITSETNPTDTIS